MHVRALRHGNVPPATVMHVDIINNMYSYFSGIAC